MTNTHNTPAYNMLKRNDALLIVDVQNDFCPGGALPIQDGDKIVSIINCWIEAAVEKNIPIYVSRDWHPVGHISFKESGLWPPHCIQDSNGAQLHPDLRLPTSTVKITKGVRFDQDQNSAFDQTGLSDRLRRDGIEQLWVMGLAEDVCVLATVLDGLRKGFDVVLTKDATRSITPESGKEARQKMKDAGARII
uniref:nicotinamidase n=1 Tax=Candidatus Kentrum sp. TUN TaxID=2126343 RepID=A0A451A597_9GAMM|nr:MAG: nicotinamidase/pyrazinamidase [Candidatus Kentron sp. TUN]VFK70361.1 MAG: nicotinamidase/pyrazinamidase [Candidatus Kentron sp. TUN]